MNNIQNTKHKKLPNLQKTVDLKRRYLLISLSHRTLTVYSNINIELQTTIF